MAALESSKEQQRKQEVPRPVRKVLGRIPGRRARPNELRDFISFITYYNPFLGRRIEPAIPLKDWRPEHKQAAANLFGQTGGNPRRVFPMLDQMKATVARIRKMSGGSPEEARRIIKKMEEAKKEGKD